MRITYAENRTGPRSSGFRTGSTATDLLEARDGDLELRLGRRSGSDIRFDFNGSSGRTAAISTVRGRSSQPASSRSGF